MPSCNPHRWDGHTYGEASCINCGAARFQDIEDGVCPNGNLQDIIIDYLEERGWYFDYEHIMWVFEYKDKNELFTKQPNIIRTAHGWTLPQWGDYWKPAPNAVDQSTKRRHENLQDAMWSQILREEEPETYGYFYGDT